MVRFSAEDEEEEEMVRGGGGTKRKLSGSGQEEEEEAFKIAAQSRDLEEKRRRESSSTTSGGGGISATIDPDVLDCPVCFEPLRPPLFQCQNGHVACSSCCNKLQNKCPSCKLSINYSRCLALEKVIESIKVPCPYAKDGCKGKLSYAEHLSHADTCIFAPCFCPMPSCTFSASAQLLSSHFDDCHRDSFVRLPYDVPVPIFLDCKDPFCVLRGPRGEIFLLLNDEGCMNSGNGLSMACIGPQGLEGALRYELAVARNGDSLQLKACMTNVKKWMGSYPTNVFLVVPQDFQVCGKVIVDIRIQKQLP
ncbi:E3 ubiquitin-protein ligase SINA-like 10 [Iris pallida]|uniref:RING-type E3 ubiquitin transferase n=1 Tax=Iris pallida TaxID=29817 RepID=A0AAX6FXS8_IRIPA|nr:E3 ubiquitin-protein ligase SINA-like 10 [Iris pallida]